MIQDLVNENELSKSKLTRRARKIEAAKLDKLVSMKAKRINQLVNNPRLGVTKSKIGRRQSIFMNCPQISGVCTAIKKASPKKPNSADRSIAVVLVRDRRTGKKISIRAYIPGEKHNLQIHSMVLIQGGKRKDLPGVSAKVVRGARDAQGVVERRQGRSRYGAPKPK